VDGDEAFDLLDGDGRPTGRQAGRAEVHARGLWHRALHLWVMHDDGSVLLQRRAATKDLSGGRIDVSVAGHVRAGETFVEALRESEEEIGLPRTPADVTFLITLRSERHYDDGRIDREFQDVYATLSPYRDPSAYRLDCGEVSVVHQAPLARVIDLYERGTPIAAAGFDCQRRRNDALLFDGDLIAQGRAATVTSLRALAVWWGGRQD
jgi:isopentenyldiphosphate isomerase